MPYRRPQPRAEARFGLFRVRSPLLTESRLLSVPSGTEMFQFPEFAFDTYAFSVERWPKPSGCPIRRSQDHCLVTGSLGLIAGSNVLHRLSTPRHPPHALIDLVMPTRPRHFLVDDHRRSDGRRRRSADARSACHAGTLVPGTRIHDLKAPTCLGLAALTHRDPFVHVHGRPTSSNIARMLGLVQILAAPPRKDENSATQLATSHHDLSKSNRRCA